MCQDVEVLQEEAGVRGMILISGSTMKVYAWGSAAKGDTVSEAWCLRHDTPLRQHYEGVWGSTAERGTESEAWYLSQATLRCVSMGRFRTI